MSAPIKLAVLISGSGTTLQNLVLHIAGKHLEASIPLVIASRASIVGIHRAQEAKLPVHVLERKSFADLAPFSEAVFGACRSAGVDLVCLAGWLCLLKIPEDFRGRVMNIHPALLPSFGGAGMYGPRVHEAVLVHGCKVSGCTVHFVDDVYDAGPIILQRVCPVMDSDSALSLAHRVFDEEKIAYPEAIRLYAQKRLKIVRRRVFVLPESA